MAKTKIHGAAQIQTETITDSQVALTAGIKLSKLENIGTGFTLRGGTDGTVKKVRQIIGESVNEIPDGSLCDFTIDYMPIASTEEVYLNGLLQMPQGDYTIVNADKTITFINAPELYANILISYLSEE